MFEKIRKNLFWAFFSKIITLLLGLLIPKFLIITYGSEMNGLLSTITQIFTYISLLEAGIGNATINALYEPLDSKNIVQVNGVLSQARNYYRRVSLYYATCVFLFSILFPAFAKTTIDKITICLVVFLQGASGFVSYYYTASYVQLLTADGKKYIVENILLVLHILTSLVKIVLVLIGVNVVFIQLSFLIITLLKIPLIRYVVHSRYRWLKLFKTKEKSALKERNAFLVHELSSVVFSNTDVFLISVFCSFSLASVYAVYNLIYSTLNTMINTANAGLGFILGQNYYKDKQKLTQIYDLYSNAYVTLVFSIMTVAYVLTGPFIRLYTNGFNDEQYVLPYVGLLFSVINLMSGARAVAARLITVSGKADDTKYRSIFEMLINIFASIILVESLGIYGVLIGTIIALTYRMNDIIIYANIRILKRKPLKEYAYLMVHIIVFAMITICSRYLNLAICTYVDFLKYAFILICVSGIIYVFLFSAFNIVFIKKTLKKLLSSIRKCV